MAIAGNQLLTSKAGAAYPLDFFGDGSEWDLYPFDGDGVSASGTGRDWIRGSYPTDQGLLGSACLAPSGWSGRVEYNGFYPLNNSTSTAPYLQGNTISFFVKGTIANGSPKREVMQMGIVGGAWFQDGYFYWRIYNGGQGNLTIATDNQLNLSNNTWTHVMITTAGYSGFMGTWINGNFVAASNYNNAYANYANSPSYLGQVPGGTDAPIEYMDHMRTFSRYCGGTEATQLMQEGLP